MHSVLLHMASLGRAINYCASYLGLPTTKTNTRQPTGRTSDPEIDKVILSTFESSMKLHKFFYLLSIHHSVTLGTAEVKVFVVMTGAAVKTEESQ
jgi:hypothetical protein